MNPQISEDATCEGCLLHNYEYADSEDTCLPIEEGVENECPCRTCLVKVMCEDTCQARGELVKKIKGYFR